MRNNLYKETFEQCQLSEECLGKVRNMRETSKRTKKYGIRYAAVVAVVLSILAGSNIISYAATGAGIAENVKIYLQSEGKKKEVTTSSDGTYEYKKGDTEYKVVPEERALKENDMQIEGNIDEDSGEAELIIKDKK